MTNQTRNEVLLEGIPVGGPEPSHENHGQLFYRQILEVPRLSGTADRLPLLVRQTQLPLLKEGVPLRVEGQLRSFNNRSGPGRRLVLTVYARSLQPGLGERSTASCWPGHCASRLSTGGRRWAAASAI